jgi:hypothetical protein
MTAWTSRDLRQFLSLPPATLRVYDLSQFLAELDEDVLDPLGCDFIMLPNQNLPPELRPDGCPRGAGILTACGTRT